MSTVARVPRVRLSAARIERAFDAVPFAILGVLLVSIYLLDPQVLNRAFLEIKVDASVTLVLAAAGETLVILTGGIDLSVGGMISVSNSLAATHMGDSGASVAGWTFLIALFGTSVGIANGLLVSVLRVPPFIATLATWSILDGFALLVLDQDGGAASNTLISATDFRLVGLPASAVFLIALALVWSWLRRTRWGTYLYAVGSNARAATLAGTPIVLTRTSAYAASGLLASLAGIYRTVNVGSGSPIAGDALILPAIAAVVLGGTLLAGGRGGVGMTIIGAMSLLFINDLTFFAGISTFYTPMVQGVLLVVAVAVIAFGNRLSARRTAQ